MHSNFQPCHEFVNLPAAELQPRFDQIVMIPVIQHQYPLSCKSPMIQALVCRQSGTNTLFYHKRRDVDTSATKGCRMCHLRSIQIASHQYLCIRSQKLHDRQMMQFPSEGLTSNQRTISRQHRPASCLLLMSVRQIILQSVTNGL